MQISHKTIRLFAALGIILLGICGASILSANGILKKNGIEQKSANGNEKKISFYFQNIDIRALLQIIAKSSGLNFVISDNVKGSITLTLKNVTWEQALNTVIKARGLAARRDGNVVFVSTVDEIVGNEARQLQSSEQLSNLAPLVAKIYKLKYANAIEVANLLKGQQSSLLTPRGQVAIDTRTNSVIIRDTRSNLAEITRTIQSIDVPAKQVLIEARIVNINTKFEEQIGVRFGISDARHLSGTLEGATKITNGTSPGDVPIAERLNFNNPAQAIRGFKPGSFALAMARLGPILLDLELSALEGEEKVKIISRPRVVTSNQQKAIIQTGEEIPYQEATSSGATSVSFKKAVLSLEIVPQITPDNKIILNLKATQDSRGTDVATGPNTSIPAINTQQVESNIILNNNETVVIGGIFKQEKNNSMERVPFFGSLPIVGALFRHTKEFEDKRELLVFITPKIINSMNGTASDMDG